MIDSLLRAYLLRCSPARWFVLPSALITVGLRPHRSPAAKLSCGPLACSAALGASGSRSAACSRTVLLVTSALGCPGAWWPTALSLSPSWRSATSVLCVLRRLASPVLALCSSALGHPSTQLLWHSVALMLGEYDVRSLRPSLVAYARTLSIQELRCSTVYCSRRCPYSRAFTHLCMR